MFGKIMIYSIFTSFFFTYHFYFIELLQPSYRRTQMEGDSLLFADFLAMG